MKDEEIEDINKRIQKLKNDKRNLELEVENLNEVSVSKPKKRRLGTLRVLNSNNEDKTKDKILVINKATQVIETREMICLRCMEYFSQNDQLDDENEYNEKVASELKSLEDELRTVEKENRGLASKVYKLQESNKKLAELAYVRFRRFKVEVPKKSNDVQIEISDQSIQVKPVDLEQQRSQETFVNYCDL